MKNLVGAVEVGVMMLTAVCFGGDSLRDGFVSPPMSARPQTWWHWMNGNVTKAGITADLEAMKEVGLGGASLFDAGCGVPAGPLAFNSPEWFDHVRYACAEARRLGLAICLPNCSGWSSSGGPWNPPANGMKFLAHVTTNAVGPARFEAKLAPIPNPHGFAADIAVVAVPVPSADGRTMEKAGVRIARPAPRVTVFSFPEPYEASGLAFRLEHKWAWEIDGAVTVETSEDGTSWSPLMTGDANVARRANDDKTLRFEAFPRTVRARHYRVTFAFTTKADDPNDAITVKGVEVHDLAVTRGAAVTRLYDKTLRKRMTIARAPEVPSDRVVPKASVRDITKCLGADGVLRWDVPAGSWRIIRLGYAANGRENHPASAKGGGPEVDKLSASALDYHFEQYAAKLVKYLGPLAGDVSSGLSGILVDSYEVGTQNWTQGLEREFARRRGYEMTPYYPVLAGTLVGSVDESDRFLADFRRTVADLFAEGYSGALAKKCHEYGLKLSLEPYGNCPGDDLEYGDSADVPMGEFWSQVAKYGDRCVDVGNAKMPSYLAHVWGRRYVGAEAFTTSSGRWRTTPFSIKAQGDRAFTYGVNRLIFHCFAHQPWTDVPRMPGATLGPYGMYLNRSQTWWKFARPWMDYLARCQWMLQEGAFVADVLYWHGEESPSRGGHILGVPEDFADTPVPAGYDRDVCSTRALLRLRVEDGQIVAPGGTRYALLVLQDVDEMSPEALGAVERILAAGGRVAAPRRPTHMPGLRDYPRGDAAIDRKSASVWARGIIAGRAAEGLAALGLPPDVIVKGRDGVPSPSAAGGGTPALPMSDENGVAWIHRVYEDGGQGYFIACPNETARDVTCSFRVDGYEPEIWDAETGETGLRPRAWKRAGGRTEVTVRLRPSGSAFVLFRKRTESRGAAQAAEPAPRAEAVVAGAWRVSFPVEWYSKGTRTTEITMDALADWTTLADPELKYFSGTATYAKRIDLPDDVRAARWSAPTGGEASETVGSAPTGGEASETVGSAPTGGEASDTVGTAFHRRPSSRLVLDLGEVKNLAEVTVNGKTFAPLWRPPYRVDVTDAVPADARTVDVTIRVANLWPNRMIGDDRLCAPDCEWTGARDCGLKAMPDFVKMGRPSPTGRHTFATWRHWTKDDATLPSGLLGPVKMVVER